MALPAAFIDKYQNLLGSEAARLFAAITEGTYQKGFRINSLKPDYLNMLEKYGPENYSPAPYAKDGYLGTVSGKSLLHQAGYVYSQEPSAMLVAEALNAQPGEKILDLCAAPGGKSTQIASKLQNQGLLVSNEIFAKRAKILSENLERWGAANTVVTNHTPAELAKFFPQFFDKILVDAPCSGEGMFRKDDEAIAQWTPETPQMCAQRQKEILASALEMLQPEGTLVYSTCTFAPEEDEEIISWLVQNYSLTIETIQVAGVDQGRPEWGSVPNLEKTARIWPHLQTGEGHFVAKLSYHGEPVPTKKSKKTSRKGKNSLTKEEDKLFTDFFNKFPIKQKGKLLKFGEQVWLLPDSMPDLQKMKVLRPGLHLGTLKKNRFEPSFALAMAGDSENWPTLNISQEQWQTYVRGETFSTEGNLGWALLVLDKIPVGFGKQVQGTVKNFYPKGLRFTV